MKRLTVLALAAAAASIVVAVLASSGSANHPGSRTLTFIERDRGSTFNFVDNAPRTTFRRGEPRRISAGDEFVFTTVLLNATTRQVAGRDFGQCVATRGARRFARVRFHCEATARFADGTITIAGMPSFRGPFTVAITGGTGAYEGARGSVTITEDTNTYHFTQ